MSLRTLMDDQSIPDDVKLQILQKQGYSREMAQRALTLTNPEKTYESTSRDPMRKALGYLPGGKTIGKWAVPNDLQSLDQTIGGAAGTAVGHPFLGAEAGGTLGGMAQGKGAGKSALEAAPGAVLNMMVPALLKRIMATRIAQSMSSKGSEAIGGAAQKMFKKLNTDDLEMTPQGLANFFGQGDASPAMQRAGGQLANFRQILRTQPAFTRLQVRVPLKSFPQGPQAPASITWHMMPLSDAMDYQAQLYGKGYSIAGAPRGGVQAEPDRQLGSYVRGAISKAIAGVPRIGQRAAQTYTDLSHDYGVAATMGEIFPKAVTPQGLLNHEEIYSKVADPKRLSHLENLVGPQDTRNFMAEVAPGRLRIAEPQGGHLRIGAGIPGTPASVHAGMLHGPPTGPAAFMPKWPAVAGTIANQGATQGEEQVLGE